MNGNFIFDGIEKAKVPHLEGILRELPITAIPDLSQAAGKELDWKKNESEIFKNRLYFEVRRNLDSPREEYWVTPLSTHYIEGVMSYEPTKNPSADFRIRAVWKEVLGVECKFGKKRWALN